MSKVEFEITPVGQHSKLRIDGKLVDHARRVTIDASVDSITTVTVEYVCTETVTVEGDTNVLHVCPHGGVAWGDEAPE